MRCGKTHYEEGLCSNKKKNPVKQEETKYDYGVNKSTKV